MRFTNAPRLLSPELYEVAVREYARRAGSRALAIYRVGKIAQDGISDLDLLVVPRSASADNGHWFSVRNQLPPALRVPFRHEPDFVPPGHVDVLRFTTHVDRTLIWGEDVAANVRCLESPEQRWSMIFERLSALRRYHQKTLGRGRADLWKLMSKTKSVGISLSSVDALTGSRHADRFAAEVEALRTAFFDLDPADAGARCWELFNGGISCLESSLTSTLGLGSGSAIMEFGGRFLHGEASIPGLSEVALAERREAVLRAQRAALDLGCGGADLFTALPYTERVAELRRAARPAAWRRLVLFAVYALRDARLRVGAGRARDHS